MSLMMLTEIEDAGTNRPTSKLHRMVTTPWSLVYSSVLAQFNCVLGINYVALWQRVAARSQSMSSAGCMPLYAQAVRSDSAGEATPARACS